MHCVLSGALPKTYPSMYCINEHRQGGAVLEAFKLICSVPKQPERP